MTATINFVSIVLFAVLGAIVSASGFPITTWQFWAVLGIAFTIGIINFCDGLNRG